MPSKNELNEKEGYFILEISNRNCQKWEKIAKMQDSDSRIKEKEKGYLLVSNLYSLPKILGEVLRGMFKAEVIHRVFHRIRRITSN